MTLFGAAHLTVLSGIAAIAGGLAFVSQRSVAAAGWIRNALGCLLVANELVWYGFRYYTEGFRFPEGLPLELCDVVVWLAAAACFSRSVTATEFVYFTGVGGSGMALLTPDLWAPLLSYPSLYFFAGHGLVVIAAIALVFGSQVRLRSGAVWRVFGLLNVYVAFAGIFNIVFGTNYVYLRSKPESASILDWFGPWPVYIVVAEVFALVLFGLLWLPVRRWRAPAA